MTEGEGGENAQLGAGPRPSRRAFLVGGGLAVVAGAGTGVGVEFWRDPGRSQPAPRAPRALLGALAAERELIAGLDASLAGPGPSRAALRQVRSDHVAHERAVAAALTSAGLDVPAAATGSAGPSGAAPAPAALDDAGLRAAETRAARRAVARADALTGRDAALLASIAACEASHAELLA